MVAAGEFPGLDITHVRDLFGTLGPDENDNDVARVALDGLREVDEHAAEDLGAEGVAEVEDEVLVGEVVLGGVGVDGFDGGAAAAPVSEAGDIGLGGFVKRGVELDTEDAAKGQLSGDEERAALAGADVNEGVVGVVANRNVAQGRADVGGACGSVGVRVGELADKRVGYLLDITGGGDVTCGVEPPLLEGANRGADVKRVGAVLRRGEGHGSSTAEWMVR